MIRKFNVTVNGVAYDVEVEEVKDFNNEKGEKGIPTSKDQNIIKAPMPGTINDIKIKEGDIVKKGEIILILEAMKMENEIMAPQDGIVANIKASKGAAVNLGEVLVVLK